MWDQFKSLWRGRSPAVMDDEAEIDGASAAERDAALFSIDRALDEGDTVTALAEVRKLLLGSELVQALFQRAGRLMEAIEEDELSRLFERAAVAGTARDETDTVAELAATFLGMDDAPVALALGRAARASLRREGARDDDREAFVVAIEAEAAARTGDADRAIALLEGFEGRWPEPVLLRRYALSSVLAGERARFGRVAEALAADPKAAWITRAAKREATFDADADAGAPLRHVLFVEYGAVLLDAEEAVRGERLAADRLARIMRRASEVLKGVGAEVDRIAYTSHRGEVFAMWLAGYLHTTAIPLSARIHGQHVLVVVADDDDLLDASGHAHYTDEPSWLFQVVKEPRRAGLPAADLVGVLGEAATLPLDGVLAPRAADRVPPRMLAGELEAKGARTEEDGSWPDRGAWVEARGDWLSLASPSAADERPTYLADLPAWAFPTPG